MKDSTRRIFEAALPEAEILCALDEIAREGTAAYIERVKKAYARSEEKR